MGTRQASSLSRDGAVHTPLRSTVSHDTSTQLPLTEFLIGCIFSNDPFDRQGSSSVQGDSGSASPPQPPDIGTTCSLSSSSLDRDGHVHTMIPRVLLQPPPGCPLVHGTAATPSMFSYLSHAPHSQLFVPPMWEHILCAQLQPAREVPVPPLREPTVLSIQILVQGLALFLNRESLFFLWSSLVNPNLMGTVTLILPTVISCIINFVFPSFKSY